MIDLSRWDIVAERRATFVSVTPGSQERIAEFMPAIHRLAGSGVKPEDLIVRGMRIVNTERDYYFSRFAPGALNEIVDLMPGRPVMRAHATQTTMPVGRFFAAQRILIQRPNYPQRDNLNVESLFYMPNDEEGQFVARRIDTATWPEVSLSWKSVEDRCGICASNIRACPHIPGEVYDDGICDYEMSGVVSVNEGSFVYSGGQKNTHTFNPDRGLADIESRLREQSSLMLGEFLTPAQLIEYKRAAAEGESNRSLDELLTRTAAKNAVGLRSNLGALLMAKARFGDKSDASRWARGHAFRADRVEETGDAFVFHQRDLGNTETRVIKVDDGVMAQVAGNGRTKRDAPESETRESPNGNSLDTLFA